MQIHELNSFAGTPSADDYLAIDDGTETARIPATNVGVTAVMTVAEANTGTDTDSRVISPSVLNSYAVDRATGRFTVDTSATSGDDYNLKTALTNMGWLNTVSSNLLAVKKLLTNILNYLNASKKQSRVAITSSITAGASAAVSSAYATKISNNIVFFEGTFKTTTAMTAGTEYEIGTITGTYAPGTGSVIATATNGLAGVTSSGVVRIRPTVAISNGASIYIRAVYLI